MTPSSRSGSFLFALPNSIQDASSRRSFTAGVLLTAVGAVCVVNASVATAIGAVKHYSIGQYYNVHWISCLYILAGVALILTQTQRLNFFLFMGVTLTTIALCLSSGTIIATIVNLAAIRRYQVAANERQRQTVSRSGDQSSRSESEYEFHTARQTTALVSDSVSLLCAIVAANACAAALHEVRHRTTRYFSNVGGRSLGLVVTGAVIFLVSLTKLVFYGLEMAWLQNNSKQYYFINYTLEEPTWIVISAVTGLLIVFESLNGSRILLHTSLVFSMLTYYPHVVFLWIDYRWLTQISATEVAGHDYLASLLNGNLSLSVASIVCSVVATVLLALRLARHKVQLFELNFVADHSIRKILGWLPVLLGLAGVFFLLSDILNGHYGTFFRVFYPTEQKMPFILIPTAAVCVFVLRDTTLRYLVLPVAFAMLCQSIQSTLFHISAYVYLAQNKYFGEAFCELFYNVKSQDCQYRIELEGAVIHFFEAVVAVVVLLVSAIGAVVIGRIMGMHALPGHRKQPATSPVEAIQQTRRRFHQSTLLLLSMALLTIAILGLPLSIHFSNGPFGQSSPDHPIFTLHKTINIACFLSTYFLLSVTQLVWAPRLARHPLRAICLVLLHSVRIMDILMLMDYRNISNNFTAHNLVILLCELVCLPISFLSIVECGFVLDIAAKALPKFDFSEPGETDSGYHESSSPNYVSHSTPSHSDSQSIFKVEHSDHNNGAAGRAPHNPYTDHNLANPIGHDGAVANHNQNQPINVDQVAIHPSAATNSKSLSTAHDLHSIGGNHDDDDNDHYVQLSDLAMIISDTDDYRHANS